MIEAVRPFYNSTFLINLLENIKYDEFFLVEEFRINVIIDNDKLSTKIIDHLYFCFILVTDDDSDVENVLFYSSRILTLTTVLFNDKHLHQQSSEKKPLIAIYVSKSAKSFKMRF